LISLKSGPGKAAFHGGVDKVIAIQPA